MTATQSEESFHAAPSPLKRQGLILRLSMIVFIVGGIAALFAYAGGWLTPSRLTPTRIVDAFQAISGPQPGFRRNHAKGIGFSGYFEGNGAGVGLSRASVFEVGRVPVVGRFALAGGQPYAGDAAQNVRSMAVQFKLRDGEEWRTGMNNIPVFVVSTPKAFYEQLEASRPDPVTGKPNSAAMQQFMLRNPEFGKALAIIRAAPQTSGFENTAYSGLNAFRFTNAAGEVANVRWTMVPVQQTSSVPDSTQPSDDKNFLFDALIRSVKRQPLQWRLVVTVAKADDVTSDATIPWPADREKIDVGTLNIDHVEGEETSPARDINFDPLSLPAGIAGSDDPLLSARSAAYSPSFTRREGEPKSSSAVSTLDTGKK